MIMDDYGVPIQIGNMIRFLYDEKVYYSLVYLEEGEYCAKLKSGYIKLDELCGIEVIE